VVYIYIHIYIYIYTANKPENVEREGVYCSKTGICESIVMFSGKKSLNLRTAQWRKFIFKL
jgi:hypothetical protein